MSEDIRTVAVLGAGTMGLGIAHVAALAGFETRLFDPDEATLTRAREKIEANLEKGVSRGKVEAEDRDAALERLTFAGDDAAALEGADLVIEAVPENLDLKKVVLGRAAEVAGEDAVLASNTSSLPVTGLAASVPNPERVVGMHFFNPPHIVRLLEIVRAEQTSEATVEVARSVGEAMNREVIVVTDSAGFATSRLGLVLGLEAIRMVEQGVAEAKDIDQAMKLGYRHPMGPLELTDMVGLDVRLAIAEHLHNELGGDQFRPPQLLRRMVRAGKLGRKVGQGFYSWDAPAG